MATSRRSRETNTVDLTVEDGPSMPASAWTPVANYREDVCYVCFGGVTRGATAMRARAIEVCHLYGLVSSLPNVRLVDRGSSLGGVIGYEQVAELRPPYEWPGRPGDRLPLPVINLVPALDVANVVGAPESMADTLARMQRLSAAIEAATPALDTTRPVIESQWALGNRRAPDAVPLPGTKPYARIVKRGCVGEKDTSGDWSCEYGWGCDSCPVVVERERLLSAERRAAKGTRLFRFLTMRAKPDDLKLISTNVRGAPAPKAITVHRRKR